MSLQLAWNHLNSALVELKLFSRDYPERMDDVISDAMDHTETAYRKLDSDFYAEHEAQPLATLSFMVEIVTRHDITGDKIVEVLERLIDTDASPEDETLVTVTPTYK